MLSRLGPAARFLILPLIVFTGCLVWILQENLEFAQFRSELESEQEAYVADSEETWKTTIASIDALLARQEFIQEPMTRSDWNIFRAAHQIFVRRLDRSPRDSAGPEARIHDLAYLAQISWKIRKFQDAEQALEELLQLTGEPDGSSDGMQDVRLRALNWKSCLLVNYREPEAALQTALECIEACELRLKSRPGNEAVQGLLALALRNASVIEEVLGRDGTAGVRHAIDIVSQILPTETGPPVDHQLAVHAFLVDARQMLGYLHFRHGRYQEALAAWFDAVVDCQRLVQRAETLARQQSISIPVLRFRKAKRRLESDIEQLKFLADGARNGETPGSIEPDVGVLKTPVSSAQWAWTPLRPGDGLSELAIDRLIKSVLPGEFEPQEAILVSWSADNSWSHPTVLEVVRAIQETTRAVVLVPDDELREEAVEEISTAGMSFDGVEFVTLATNTVWARDYGPLTVKCDDGAVRIACSMFKDSFEDPAPENDFLPVAWSRVTGWPVFRLPVLIEAGAILSNGDGLCLASEFLLAKNAESGVGERQVTAALKRLTGADQVVYLQPLLGEETGHVDWFAVFTSSDTVVIGDYYGIDVVNAQILDDNARRLAGIKTRKGPLNVERIPMPPRGKGYFGGTYTNVVFANGNLLVPTWPEASRKHEEKALSVYRRLLPDWKIVPIDSQDFGRKQGSLHCATMNLYRYRPPQLLTGSDS
jgi:agmatine/peptidylarginine deiminase